VKLGSFIKVQTRKNQETLQYDRNTAFIVSCVTYRKPVLV